MATGKTPKMHPAQREALRQQRLQERFKYESQNMRGYELIFPTMDKEKSEKYDMFINKSQDLWDEFYMGKKNVGIRSNLKEALSKKVTKMFSTMQSP